MIKHTVLAMGVAAFALGFAPAAMAGSGCFGTHQQTVSAPMTVAEVPTTTQAPAGGTQPTTE